MNAGTEMLARKGGMSTCRLIRSSLETYPETEECFVVVDCESKGVGPETEGDMLNDEIKQECRTEMIYSTVTSQAHAVRIRVGHLGSPLSTAFKRNRQPFCLLRNTTRF
jgi:hypothetical protein